MKRVHRTLPLLLAGALAVFLVQCQSAQQVGNSVSVAEAFESALTDVVERTRAAVVRVSADVRDAPFFMERNPFQVSGTAFIFRPDGYLLTNDHVVRGALSTRVQFSDGSARNARVVGSDPNTDIAVLKIDSEPEERFPSLELADSDAVRVGQFAVSFGNPLHLNFSANIGIVSAKGRTNLVPRQSEDDQILRYQDFIQTDAYMNQGNSGGPLLNLRGEVVGINTMIRTRGQGSDRYIGLGFAIPSNMAKTISDQLIQRGRVVRGWLGISYEVHESGIRVEGVIDESPAGEAGFQRGDIIVAVDSEPLDVSNSDELRQHFQWKIAMSPVGQKVRFKTLREGEVVHVDAALDEMPARHAGRMEPRYPLSYRLGLRRSKKLWPHTALEHSFEEGDGGALILRLSDESPAAGAGVKTGDLVIEVNGEAVKAPADLEAALRGLPEDAESITLTVKSPRSGSLEDAAEREAAIPIGALRD